MRKTLFVKWICILTLSLLLCGCSDNGEVQHLDMTRCLKESVERERTEQEAKEKAEREAKEKAEQEAKEKAEREAKEKAEREAKEKAEREAKEKAEREAREKAEREAREKAEQEALEKADEELQEKILGGWRSEGLDVSDIVEGAMKEARALEPYLQFDRANLTVQTLFVCSGDGKAVFSMDNVSYNRLMDHVTEEVSNAAVRYFEAHLKKWGLNVSVESYLKKMGISLETYVADIVAACSADFQPDDVQFECFFQVRDGKLYVADRKELLEASDSYFLFEVNDIELKLLQYFEGGKANKKPMGQDVSLPLEFFRING